MKLNRRKFMKLSTSGLFGLSVFNIDSSNDKKEISIVEYLSKLRKEGGYSCSECMFLSILKYLNKPEELVCIASGFGGGIKMKDLCGLYTGGVMGIGLFCGKVSTGDKEAGRKCTKLTMEYTKWWRENFPLYCRDIKPDGAEREVCNNVGYKASEFLEKLFERK